jgi:SAM-dependent methyltransferase
MTQANAGRDAIYVPGYTEDELQRLTLQGRLVGRTTRALLVEAGLELGMRVLDVGCGVGDVSLLLAELVGSSGEVVGVDTNARALELAPGTGSCQRRQPDPSRCHLGKGEPLGDAVRPPAQRGTSARSGQPPH